MDTSLQHYKQIDAEWEQAAVAAGGLLPSLNSLSVVSHLTKAMPKDSLVLKLVDICDLELSVVPELFRACRDKSLKVIWVVNRVDCLPRDAKLDE